MDLLQFFPGVCMNQIHLKVLRVRNFPKDIRVSVGYIVNIVSCSSDCFGIIILHHRNHKTIMKLNRLTIASTFTAIQYILLQCYNLLEKDFGAKMTGQRSNSIKSRSEKA